MTRRGLLRALAVGLGGLALLFWWRPGWLTQTVARRFKPRLDSSSPTGTLSQGEMDSVLAFAEVLVEGRVLSAEEKGYLVEHVSDRTRNTPGYLSLYRMTAQLLDRLAGTRFSALGLGDRAAVMIRHRLTSYDARIREFLVPFHRQEFSVRVLAVPDLITGYYLSPAGWAVVGYRAFPGRCGGLIRYTLPEP